MPLHCLHHPSHVESLVYRMGSLLPISALEPSTFTLQHRLHADTLVIVRGNKQTNPPKPKQTKAISISF